MADVRKPRRSVRRHEDTPYGGNVLDPRSGRHKAKIVGRSVRRVRQRHAAAADARCAAIKPATVHVVVRERQRRAGPAPTIAAARLQKLGYVIDSVGNADTFDYESPRSGRPRRCRSSASACARDLGVDGAAVIAAPPTRRPARARS